MSHELNWKWLGDMHLLSYSSRMNFYSSPLIFRSNPTIYLSTSNINNKKNPKKSPTSQTDFQSIYVTLLGVCRLSRPLDPSDISRIAEEKN